MNRGTLHVLGAADEKRYRLLKEIIDSLSLKLARPHYFCERTEIQQDVADYDTDLVTTASQEISEALGAVADFAAMAGYAGGYKAAEEYYFGADTERAALLKEAAERKLSQTPVTREKESAKNVSHKAEAAGNGSS